MTISKQLVYLGHHVGHGGDLDVGRLDVRVDHVPRHFSPLEFGSPIGDDDAELAAARGGVHKYRSEKRGTVKKSY